MELKVKLNAKRNFLMCSILLLIVSCNENVAFQTVSSKKSHPVFITDPAKDVPSEVATTTTSPIPADPNGTCGRVSNLEMCAQTTGCQPLLEEDISGASTIIGCIAVANAPVVVVAKAPVVEVVKAPEVVAAPAAAPVVVVAKAPVVEVVKVPEVVAAPAVVVAKAPVVEVAKNPAVATVVVKTPVVSTAVSLSETKYSTNNEREDEDEDKDKDKDKDNSKASTCTKVPRVKIPQTCNSIAAQFKINHNREIKVVICHHSDKKAETIAIACPALSAHLSHGEDVLGACVKEELVSVKK
jgi:hypothetical protein